MIYDAYGNVVTSSPSPRQAQLSKKIVFWRHGRTKKLVMGCPEQWPAPKGWEKIVCGTVYEAERYSQMMRDQERAEEALTDEEREQIEGSIRAEVRRDLLHRMETSPNALTRDFCRLAIRKMDEAEDKTKMKRESFLHAEGFEQGH